MIHYTYIMQPTMSSITCNRCKRKIIDPKELQEAHCFSFITNHGSVFGDRVRVTCELCQDCFEKLLGEFCVTFSDSDNK